MRHRFSIPGLIVDPGIGLGFSDLPRSIIGPYHQLQTMELLAEHAQQGGVVLAALHDLSIAARFCARSTLPNKNISRKRRIISAPPSKALRANQSEA